MEDGGKLPSHSPLAQNFQGTTSVTETIHEKPLEAFLESPIAKTENGSKASLTRNTAKIRYEKQAVEVLQNLVGPMPMAQFIREFFHDPFSEEDMPPSNEVFGKIPVAPNNESKLITPIVNALNTPFINKSGTEIQRCPGIVFHYTGDNQEQIEGEENRFDSKYDITGYLEDDPIFGGNQNVLAEGKARTLPGMAQLVIELRMEDIAKDPEIPGGELVFPQRLNLDGDDINKLAIGQIGSYATEVCARQHRNFLFMLFMTPKVARLLRWDRAGVVISSAFDYRKEAKILCQFLWQFGKATHAQRGCDTGVKWASAREEVLFKARIERHVRSQLGDDFKGVDDEIDRHYEAARVVKLPVRSIMQNGAVKERSFLVSRPLVSPSSMASRATRGYWAMDVETEQIVFLKDAWRTNVEGMEVEGDIIRSIEEAPNVPTMVCYGDVGDTSSFDHAYITQTDRYRTAEWNAHRPPISRLTSRIHHRQAIKEAGYNLEHLAGCGELLWAVRDVYDALEAVYVSDGRMHRDISTGNIILFADDSTRKYGNRRGILIDWELSCNIEREHARKHWRTGTWAFMSINTLARNPGPHALVHDAESLAYVVFYCAIFFLKWNYSVDILRTTVDNFFDQSAFYNGDEDDQPFIKGGNGKKSNLWPDFERGQEFALHKGLPTVIHKWLRRSLDHIAQWYTPPLPNRTAEVQKKMARPIFDLSGDIFKDIPINDREYSERPTFKGRSLLNLPATHTSATPPPSI
ncbi:hypothetical protein BDN70DRAFT_849042 [Pholiota conissans]|uniref:Fungal-type protein kinase domain-containing protein n=1 Tax=Pholiota conissans TaxID=109636 RepID=A0A9P6CZ36_9AGAR|nr:hypothetical protein BDN70DRAFT_849042 [Pholiota conissans]